MLETRIWGLQLVKTQNLSKDSFLSLDITFSAEPYKQNNKSIENGTLVAPSNQLEVRISSTIKQLSFTSHFITNVPSPNHKKHMTLRTQTATFSSAQTSLCYSFFATLRCLTNDPPRIRKCLKNIHAISLFKG